MVIRMYCNIFSRCVKIGDDPQTAVAQRKILEDRDKAIQEYEVCPVVFSLNFAGTGE